MATTCISSLFLHVATCNLLNMFFFFPLGSIAISFLEIGGLFGSIASGYVTDKLVKKVGHQIILGPLTFI